MNDCDFEEEQSRVGVGSHSTEIKQIVQGWLSQRFFNKRTSSYIPQENDGAAEEYQSKAVM